MSGSRSGSLRAFALCLSLACTPGCGFWRTVPDDATRTREVRGNTVRLRKGDRQRIVRVVRVEYPLLEGVEDAPEGPVAVVLNLADFDQVEVYDETRGLAMTSAGALVAFVVAAAAAIGIAYLSARRD